MDKAEKDCSAIFYNWRTNTIPYSNQNAGRPNKRPEKRRDPINENIRFPEVRVIGPEGEQLGIMSSNEANRLAMSYNLDLFLAAPNANPPVCKICNYGKLRFEKQKQDRMKRKNQKTQELKEIQLKPQIGQHDLDTKARKAKEFLEKGDKVLVKVVFKGRQLAHKEIGEELMGKFNASLAEVSIVEKAPYWEGKFCCCILAPVKKKQ